MPTSTYSTNKDVNHYIASLIRKGWTFLPKGHRAPQARKAGRTERTELSIAGSPSDWRALRNLQRDKAYLASLSGTPPKAR